jgi:hypothetical protein
MLQRCPAARYMVEDALDDMRRGAHRGRGHERCSGATQVMQYVALYA